MRLSRYIEIIQDQLNVPLVIHSHRFKEDLGADSLDMVELITTLEDEAEVEFDELFIDEVKVVDSLYTELLSLIRAATPEEYHREIEKPKKKGFYSFGGI